MTSHPPFDKLFAQQQVRRAYQGDLTKNERHQLRTSLEEHSDRWEEFLSAPSDPHELDPTEANDLLEVILQETTAPLGESTNHTNHNATTGWHNLLQRWQQWAFVPAALAFLLMLALPNTQTAKPLGTKNGNLKAFIKLKIHRHSKQDAKKFSVIPFEQNGYYKMGDAFLFRFLVIERGYLYLYRQDIKGNLSKIFPFREAEHKLYEAGHHTLTQSPNKPLAYFLDQKLKGHQTFWLVHANQPMTLPNHIKKLSEAQQRKLKRDSDRIQVTVFPR